MGLSARGGRGGASLGRSLTVLLCVAGFVLVSVPAEAIGEYSMENCPEGWIGIASEGGDGNRVCLNADTDPPNRSRIFGLLSPSLGYEDCPEGFAGTVAHVQGSSLGLCLRVVYQVPSETWMYVGVDLSGCELPDREGEDPVVFVSDGAVGFCAAPVAEPGDAVPSPSLSTEPCEPETTDPEIRAWGGGVRFCADVYLFGIGNPQINGVVGVYEDAREDVPGYVPTP